MAWVLLAGAPAILGQDDGRGPPVAALEEAFVRAIETAERSVVAIAKDRPQPVQSARPMPRFGGPFQQQPEAPIGPENPNYVPTEFGAGVIIDSNAERSLILTNYHVVRGGPIEGRLDFRNEFQLYVRLPDRRGFPAAIYAADPRSDLAVLRIPVGELRFLKVATGTKVRKGQFVIALGNPYAVARDGSAKRGAAAERDAAQPGSDDSGRHPAGTGHQRRGPGEPERRVDWPDHRPGRAGRVRKVGRSGGAH